MLHLLRSSTPWLAGALLLGALPAAAQPFEAIYGPFNTADQGARRVSPVVQCAGGGFIAVGTTGVGAANSQLYVVRTTAAGVSLWENAYDIPGQQDEGRALVELANGAGFVLLGNSFNINWQTALVRIDCAGNVVWTQTYRWNALAWGIRGFDLIETRFGDPAHNTAAGDLAVAGYVTSGGATPNEDAVLFRTRANGALLWNQAYKLSGQERFNALTEAAPSFGAPAGDLVAAGSATVGTDSQALVARVDGNNGLYGGPNRCVSNYGNADDLQAFFSVIELRIPPFAGHLAFAGLTNGMAYSDDIYLLRTQANPCTPLAQARLGDANAPQIDREVALDLRELLQPLAGPTPPPVGSLVLTGDVADVAFTVSDVPLVAVQPGNFALLSGRRFGSQLARNEVGFSLERIPDSSTGTIYGYVIAGFSTSDREGLGDPRDLYLVATDGQLETPCSQLYTPILQTLPWPVGYFDPTTYQGTVANAAATTRLGLDTDVLVCP